MQPKYSLNREHELIWRGAALALLVVMLVSAACGPTATPPPQPTPGVTSMPASTVPLPLPTPTRAPDLPPALAEIQPLPGSTLALDGSLTFYFSTHMQHAAVEGALQFEPPVPGKFTWSDDFTLRFTPDQKLALDTMYQVKLGVGARSEIGLALPEEFQFSYHTPPALKISSFLPAPDSKDINPGAVVAVSFSQPVLIPIEEPS